MKKIFSLLILLSLFFSVGCEELLSSTNDNNEDNEHLESTILPNYCDFSNFAGWDNTRFSKDGTVIFTNNFPNSQQVYKTLILQQSSQYGDLVLFAEFDSDGFPKYMSLNNSQIYIEDFDGKTFDVIYIEKGEPCYALENLSFDDTRAWGENNWVRNTCAVGQIVTSGIGIASGVAISSSGAGALAGVPMIIASCKSMTDNFEVLFGSGDDYVAKNDYTAQQLQNICMNTFIDISSQDSDSFLKYLAPDLFNKKYNNPNTFWAELSFGFVDNFWGETRTESQRAIAAIRDCYTYRVETWDAQNITETSVSLRGYVSPEGLAPLGDTNATVQYGTIMYNILDSSERQFLKFNDKKGGEFSAPFQNLKRGSTYAYFTFYSDFSNAIIRFAQRKQFTTEGEKEEEDAEEKERKLRAALIKFYKDTHGDNWFNNENWCSDKPLNDWFGVDIYNGYCYLYLSNNNLVGTGTLTGLTTLVYFSCNNNQLTSLNLSGCTSLEWLECNKNQLINLEITGCKSMYHLSCRDNQLTKLDTSGCTSLRALYCTSNQLTKLDISDSTSLEQLSCGYNQLSSLDISGFTSLVEIYCGHTQLTSLDLSGCISLGKLDSDATNGTPLISLNVSGCRSLQVLEYSHRQLLENLDVSGCTALERIECKDNRLTNLDVSNCISLEHLECNGNQLISLDVSNCTSLVILNCRGNQLTNVDVSGFTALERLECHDNLITNLNISECKSLRVLDCTNLNGQLTNLDASDCTSLEQLSCGYNQLSSLDVSNCISLEQLDCSGNQLRSLDISSCTSLKRLDCPNNQLISMNALGCRALEYLDCQNNQLTSLNISSCTSLEWLYCENNQISQVITGFYDQLSLFLYSQRYTDYWWETVYDSSGNAIDKKLHYTDNGVGWWYPGEPEKGYHGK